MVYFMRYLQKLINYLRKHSYSHKYAASMSPPVAAQIIAVLKILMGMDGTDEGQKRIAQLARNTRYFRTRIAQMGLITYGNEDSPVVPILVYWFSKIGYVFICHLHANVIYYYYLIIGHNVFKRKQSRKKHLTVIILVNNNIYLNTN